MSECCGKKRETRFCPDCGAALGPKGPGVELLKHVQKTAAHFQLRVRRYEKPVSDDPTNAYLKRQKERAQAMFDKWDGWAKWITTAIEDESAPGSTSR